MVPNVFGGRLGSQDRVTCNPGWTQIHYVGVEGWPSTSDLELQPLHLASWNISFLIFGLSLQIKVKAHFFFFLQIIILVSLNNIVVVPPNGSKVNDWRVADKVGSNEATMTVWLSSPWTGHTVHHSTAQGSYWPVFTYPYHHHQPSPVHDKLVGTEFLPLLQHDLRSPASRS